MKFLKPLFFKKYRPTQTYTYSKDWKNVSIQFENTFLSILLKETSIKACKGVVILAHPMKKNGKHFFVEAGHAQLYTKNGYHVFIFDFNGFGESENRDFRFEEDLNQVILLANKTYSNLPIFIHGVSMGGAQTILSTIENNKYIQAIIIESAASSNLDYYKHRGRMKLYNLIKFSEFFFPNINQKHLYFNQIKQLKKTPKLFIYGLNDQITPLWMGEKIYTNALQPKQIQVFNTKHLTTITEVPVKYENLIFNFLENEKHSHQTSLP